MHESAVLIDHLRRVAQASRAQLDTRPADIWLEAGVQRGQLHELYAGEPGDAACAAGFAMALALAAGALPLLWLRAEDGERRAGRPHAPGFVEMGLLPDSVVFAQVADIGALLRAAADGARCPGLGAVLIEVWGRASAIDLTATRRLILAAEASGVTVLMLRIDADPSPSAAVTRWSVTAAPSAALEAGAPGWPAFDVELLRRRGGPAGQRWRVEWKRDAKFFQAAPLFGAHLSVAAGGAAARRPAALVRRTP